MQVSFAGRRAAGVLGVLMLGIGAAHAGAFAVREQSAYGLGSAFAGIAAGGAPSSMFWNPATMTQFPGLQSESILTGIMPYAAHTPTAGSTFAPFSGTSDIATDALVPAGYTTWQVMPKLWLGLSMNSPFGLSVGFPDTWAGRNFGEDSSLKTYNFTPSVAYELTNWLSIGAGVQIQYAKADLTTGLPVNGFGFPPGLGQQANISGHGWGYGFTLGATIKPTATTTIGIGWRSAINQKIEGTFSLPGGLLFAPPVSTPGDVNTTINLPDIVTASIRQELGPQWTLLGTIEWSRWSRIGTANINRASGGPALLLNGFPGGGPVTVAFNYRDGWFYSGGAEYKWSNALALRGGIGYERTPISDDVRTPRLPDNDRLWLTVGGTYNLTPQIGLDFGYAHLFVKDTSIHDVNSIGTITYNGTVDAHVDIFSVGLKYRFGAPPAPAPLITKG